jgi:hypothetical protein
MEQYCDGILLARLANHKLSTEGPVIDGKISPWITVLEKAHRSCCALAMRLRLSPQARIDAKTLGRANDPPPSIYERMRDNAD